LTTFTRDDGRELEIVDSFRNRVINYRASQTPKNTWDDDDYSRAVEKRLDRNRRLTGTLSGHFGRLNDAEILEIGCGDGINSILLGLHGVKRAVGIDIELRLRKQDEKGESVRRLAGRIMNRVAGKQYPDPGLEDFPAELLTMDATRMDFSDESFDIVFSRSVLEHVLSIDELYSEVNRVLRPGGIIYQEIDPFYWLRGCHKRGLVDIPWAHARLTPDEYYRFVLEREGQKAADRRLERLTSLNHLSLREWEDLHENGPFEILSWEEKTSSFAKDVLGEYPEVTSTLLPGLVEDDLVVGRIRLALRKRAE
jgi:SAM-dependent methyltransferase